jgi:hypothetical protein
MDYKSATHCGFCGKDCTHHQGRILAGDKVFCDTNCEYLHDYNRELLKQGVSDDKTACGNSS